MRWDLGDFADGTPGPPDDTIYFRPKPRGYPGGDDDMDCWGEDVAVNPSTGDVYLLFTWLRTDVQTNPYRLWYYRLEEGDNWTWDTNDNGSPWIAFPYDYEINCWTPSIDVGMVKLGEYGEDWGVGIAFTAGHMDDYTDAAPYCVVGNGWYCSDDGDQYDETYVNIMPGVYVDPYWYSCGAPSFDIAYWDNNDYGPWWAIAYTQESSNDWGYDVMFIDSVNLDAKRLQYSAQDYKEKFGASVTCHVNYGYQIASVSAYENNIPYMTTGTYQPCAANFNVSSQTWNDNWTQVQSSLPTISGTFNPIDLIANNPGVSTSIVSNSNDGGYYLGFSTNVGQTACDIYGAYGNTTE
jgi:hypothetical protein